MPKNKKRAEKLSRPSTKMTVMNQRVRQSSAVLFVLAFGMLGYRFLQMTHAASACTVSSTLVNSCRPWVGAAVRGYPQAASDAKSQFLYAEKRDGRHLDIFHDYHPPGSLPLNSTEKYFAMRSSTYIYVNWKPASNWSDADGGNASVNANIDKAAASIKSIAPHKIFLTIWHEPENDVSGGTNCAIKPGKAGTPAQYRAMWKNVENRFKADGVTNVVWVMNYMGYYRWDCLVPQLWPGNSLVDWVTYDIYSSSDKSTVANTIGRMYDVLSKDSNSTTNFDSKPWGAAEWGDCKTSDQAHVYKYYQQMKSALDAGTYPRLKMYMVYDDNGNNAGMGCLTEYSKAGTYDPTEQSYYNQFVNDPILTASAPSTSSSGGSSGGSSGSGSGGTGSSGSSTSSSGSTGSGTSGSTSTTGSTSSTSSSSTTVVSGTVYVGSTQTTKVSVDGTKVLSSSGKIDTTYLTNGTHTITTTTKKPNGSIVTATRIVSVQNNLATWKQTRDFLLSSLRAHPALMNGSFLVVLVAMGAGIVFGLRSLLFREPFYKTLQKTGWVK